MFPDIDAFVAPKALSPEPPGRFIDLGKVICRWIERSLPHGEGDYWGEPFLLDPWQEYLIRRIYLVDPVTLKRIVRRTFWVLPKGNGKTPLLAAVKLAELLGPVVLDDRGRPAPRRSPNIPIAAASFEQADRLHGQARDMATIETSRIAPFVIDTEHEIRRREGKGRLFRVAAVGGTNDGGLPTGAAFDEVHEWDTDRKQRVHLVIGNSLTKRDQPLEANISTPDDAAPDSLFGRLHAYGMKVADGSVQDPSFVFAWWSTDLIHRDEDLEDPKRLRAAIVQSNPGSWRNVEAIASRYEVDGIRPHEFRRYHLGQLVRPAGAWLREGNWADLARPKRKIPKGTEVVLSFDGSLSRDTSAIIGCTLDGHVFVVGAWERPAKAKGDWMVPRGDVMAKMDWAFRDSGWTVLELACDRSWWPGEFQEWQDSYGEERVIDFANTPSQMAPACQLFEGQVSTGEGMTHDGDARLSRHLHNAVTKGSRYGTYITKEHKDSPRKIDLAVAAVMARARAAYHAGVREQEPLVTWR